MTLLMPKTWEKKLRTEVQEHKKVLTYPPNKTCADGNESVYSDKTVTNFSIFHELLQNLFWEIQIHKQLPIQLFFRGIYLDLL